MKNILGTTENLEFYNKDGVKVYEFKTNIYGYSFEYTYDKNGNTLTHRNSYGYFHKYTRDENGDELTFKNSDGNERGFDIPEFTMEELTQKLGNFKLIK